MFRPKSGCVFVVQYLFKNPCFYTHYFLKPALNFFNKQASVFFARHLQVVLHSQNLNFMPVNFCFDIFSTKPTTKSTYKIN
jgi:hypothetical protein